MIAQALAAARDFFLSRDPTAASAIGAIEVTIALVVLALLAWPVSAIVRTAARRARRVRPRTLLAAVVLTGGLLILGAGLGHHLAASTVVLGGGSLTEASQQLAH